MGHDDFALRLGKIVGNLQGLELVLRIFLCDANGERFEFPTHGQGSVPNNHLTNYDSLGNLVSIYNKGLLETEVDTFGVDASVVKTRDAIAHGRLLGHAECFPLTLYKFGRPIPGTPTEVPLEYTVELS